LADKTVNINIKYNVDTSSIKAAEAATQRAQVATDSLKQASDNFSRQFQAGTVKSTDTIAGLTLKMQQLKAQIELTSLTDTKRLAQLSGQYKALQSQVDAYNKALISQSKATKETAENTRSLASQFQEVYSAIKLIIAAGVAKEIANITLEMARLAGNTEGVERAFNRAFPGSQALLMELRQATHGAVSDFQLMQRTLQATNLGVSVEHLATLFEFAATRAQQTGESVDYLVDSIVRGIGRQSVLVLDNLGLSTKRLKDQLDGATVKAVSVAKLTEGVAEIAKQELEKMGGYFETSATEVDQLTSSWDKFKRSFSQYFTEGGGKIVLDIMKEYLNSFSALLESQNRGITVSEVFAERQAKEVAQISANEFMTRRLTGTKEENIKALQEEIQALTHSIGAYAQLRDINNSVIADLDKQRQKAFTAVPFSKKEFDAIQEEMDLRKRINESGEKDAMIDQEILKLLQSKLLLLQKISKEQENQVKSGERSLPNNIAFMSPDKGQTKKSKQAALIDRNQLVDVQKQLDDAVDQIGGIKVKITPYIPMDTSDKVAKAFADKWRDILVAGVQNTADIINASVQAEADSYQARLSQAQAFYDNQIRLAEGNSVAQDQLRERQRVKEAQLRREAFDADKKAKEIQTTINGAAAVIAAWVNPGFPEAIPLTALIAAQTAAQVAVISKQRYTGYKEGVIDLKGPGTETSDSIPAMLSRGESVMTAKETRRSLGLLRDIRLGKIDDRIFKQIVSNNVSFSDDRIVKAIKGQSYPQAPDILYQAGVAYTVHQDAQKNKRIVRSKWVNN
jgi:hypothetical protein